MVSPPPSDPLLPWTEKTLQQATKRELVGFFQSNASADFLTRHNLNGRQRAITKRAKLPALRAAYRHVLCDPLAELTRSKLAIRDAIFESCCKHSGTIAHILIRQSDYDAAKAKIEAVHAAIINGALQYTSGVGAVLRPIWCLGDVAQLALLPAVGALGSGRTRHGLLQQLRTKRSRPRRLRGRGRSYYG